MMYLAIFLTDNISLHFVSFEAPYGKMSIISECIMCMFQIIVCMDWSSVLSWCHGQRGRQTDRCNGSQRGKTPSGKVYTHKEKEKKKENIKTLHREQMCTCSPLVYLCVWSMPCCCGEILSSFSGRHAICINLKWLSRDLCCHEMIFIFAQGFVLACHSETQVADMILLLISLYMT